MSYVKVMISQDISRKGTFHCTLDDMSRMINTLCTVNRYAWYPQTDIFETEREVIIMCELAGVKLGDIRVEMDRRTLKIYGTRRERRCPQGGNYVLAEIPSGYFERYFSLTTPFNMDTVEAGFADGILQVRLEKLPQTTIRSITIRSLS